MPATVLPQLPGRRGDYRRSFRPAREITELHLCDSTTGPWRAVEGAAVCHGNRGVILYAGSDSGGRFAGASKAAATRARRLAAWPLPSARRGAPPRLTPTPPVAPLPPLRPLPP